MNTKFRFLFAPLILAFMFLLQACPQESENPIDQGSYDIPDWMNGTWTRDKINSDEIYIVKKDNNKGVLYYQKVDSGGIAYAVRKVIFSQVNGQVFVSALDIVEGSNYYLYLFEDINETQFKLIPLQEYQFEPDVEQNELKTYIEKISGDIKNTAYFNYGEGFSFFKK